MFRSQLWSLPVVALWLAVRSAMSAQPVLPPTATSEEVVWLTPIDVATFNADEVRAAAKSMFGDDAALVDPKVSDIEGLAKRGVQTLLIAKCYGPEAETIPGGKTLRILRYPRGVDRQQSVQDILEWAYGPDHAEIVATRWDDDWLTIYGKADPLRVDSKPTKRAAHIEAAYRSLGKLPGVIQVPNQRLRELDDHGRMFISSSNNMPESNIAVNDGLLNCQWASVAVKLSKSPMIRITVEMGSEANAKKLLADFGQLQTDIQANPKVKLFDLCLMTASLLKSAPKRKASQVSCQFDSGALNRLAVAAVLRPLQLTRRQAEFEVQGQMQKILFAIGDYVNKRQDFPNALEDLKPFLVKDAKDVDKAFKKAITNARTGEYPGFVYIRPPGPSADSEQDIYKVVVLKELKNGKPDPDGQRGFFGGDVENNLYDTKAKKD